MSSLTAYYLCVATSFVAYFGASTYALSVYKNVWILGYSLIIGFVIGFILLGMFPRDNSIHIRED